MLGSDILCLFRLGEARAFDREVGVRVERAASPGARVLLGSGFAMCGPSARVGAVTVVGEVRLDDAAALARELDAPANSADLELVARAWERWGADMPRHLHGDFSLALADAGLKKVFCARDRGGTRPLYYAENGGVLAVASRLEDIVALSGLSESVEDDAVGAYLFGADLHDGRTFFRGAARLLPGFTLLASGGAVRSLAMGDTHALAQAPASRAEWAERFRSQLEHAVRVRVRSPAPVLIQVSGGLDSSAIACVASSLWQSGRCRAPSVFLVHASFEGLPCDESRYVAPVADAVPFGLHRFDGRTWPAALEPSRAHPVVSPMAGITGGTLHAAGSLGARVVLSGLGGDELLFERGVFRDLARAGRFVALVRETRLVRRYSARPAGHYLRDAVRWLAPSRLRRLARSLRADRARPPPWLAPRFHRYAGASFEPPEPDAAAFTSETQRITRHWLDQLCTSFTLDIEDEQARARGARFEYPFLDRALVDLVLAMPYTARIPSGRMKRLLRSPDILPAELCERRGVTVFDALVLDRVRSAWPALRDVVLSGPWRSEPYVVRARARDLAQRGPVAHDVQSAMALWNIAMLEKWLRRLDP